MKMFIHGAQGEEDLDSRRRSQPSQPANGLWVSGSSATCNVHVPACRWHTPSLTATVHLTFLSHFPMHLPVSPFSDVTVLQPALTSLTNEVKSM